MVQMCKKSIICKKAEGRVAEAVLAIVAELKPPGSAG